MTNESELLHQQRQAEVRRMAAIIRQIEQVIPGCFGEAAAVIRQQAAGDDVVPDDLTAAVAFVRLTIRKHRSTSEGNGASRD